MLSSSELLFLDQSLFNLYRLILSLRHSLESRLRRLQTLHLQATCTVNKPLPRSNAKFKVLPVYTVSIPGRAGSNKLKLNLFTLKKIRNKLLRAGNATAYIRTSVQAFALFVGNNLSATALKVVFSINIVDSTSSKFKILFRASRSFRKLCNTIISPRKPMASRTGSGRLTQVTSPVHEYLPTSVDPIKRECPALEPVLRDRKEHFAALPQGSRKESNSL